MGLTLICKSDKAVRELGYEPASLRAMLEDSYHWLRAEGLISKAASPASPSAS